MSDLSTSNIVSYSIRPSIGPYMYNVSMSSPNFTCLYAADWLCKCGKFYLKEPLKHVSRECGFLTFEA